MDVPNTGLLSAVTPGVTKYLRRWYRQPHGHFEQTFQTPLKKLGAFSAAVLAAHPPLETGSVTIDQIVIHAKSIETLLAKNGLPADVESDLTITAHGPVQIASLLEAAWSDWIDFYFTPAPKRYRLFADHDEYTTILGMTKGQVAKVATALIKAGFTRVDGFVREW